MIDIPSPKNGSGKKILVLGTSRGGTTLVSAALGSHPDIAMLDEDMNMGLCNVTGQKIPGNKLCIPNQIEWAKRWHPAFSLGVSNGFFRKSLLMNKIPKGRFNLQDYQSLGGMHYVCILRNPAGVIASIQKRENKKPKVALYRWRRCLEVFDTLHRDVAFKTIIISFEKLLKEPHAQLEKLSNFLDIDFHEAMLEGPTKNHRYKTDKGFDIQKAHYQNEDRIWNQYPAKIKFLYDDLLKNAL